MSSTDTPSTTSATATSAATASSTSTPSPSTSSTATAPQSTNRRPRKSTLTQQQKNQKRQRATHEQLVTLEMEFNKNPTPTAAVRERIAQEINMTERSVQIWFQNRRAKIKMIAKRSIETGENCDAIPESMRQYLAMQFDPNKPGARDLFGRTSGLGGYGSGGHSSESTHSGKIVIHHFTCRSLTIGTWRRVGQNAMDLVIFYSPEKATMTYYINNDSAGYKIEYPFSYIKNITLESGDQAPNPNGTPPRPAGLVVELNRPPLFYMYSSNSGGFYQCGDFTEDQQASQVMVHHLGGHPKVLSVQLAKLVSLESFQNRLAFNNYAMSAPVSPQVIDRPASQPDCLGPVNMGMYQDGAVGVNYQAIRGHKRQRSRSVPAAVDFSALQAQMPAYHVQQPSTQFTPPDSSVFAPVPQSAHPVGTNLRVDTSSVYGMDFRSYPMSAPVTASPTDFASPSFFTTGATSEPIPVVANFAPQYNVPYVSPPPMVDPSKVIPQSTSPMPDMSHADPLIADQSPPLSTMHPSTSADMFALGAEHQSNFSDDGLMLSEMYAKQNLNLSVPSPVAMNDPGFEVAMSGLPDQTSPVVTQGDYQGMMMPFETVDPTTLAGGS